MQRAPSLARTFGLTVVLCAIAARAQGEELGLDEAVAIALRHQPQILQAHANVGIAAGQAEQVRAPLLPQVRGTLSATRNRNNSLFRSSALIPDDPTGDTPPTANSSGATVYNQFSAGLTGTQTVWDFATIQSLGAANRTIEAERATARAVTLQVVLDVRTHFFAVRAQQALTRVAKENLDNVNQHHTQIQGFVKAGINPEIDLAQSLTDVANAKVQWINARNAQQL